MLPFQEMVRNFIRRSGFDIVKVKNIEQEIRRREQEHEKRRLAEITFMREGLRQSHQGSQTASQQYLTYADRENFKLTAINLMQDVDSLLDIGCAFHPQIYIEARVHICCEPYVEYMDRLIVERSSNPKYVFINCGLQKIGEVFPVSSVDSAVLNDVIEHAEKHVGLKALNSLKKIVRKQIIVFTPLGYMPQESDETGLDPWGMKGIDWQEHLSGWMPEDFPKEEGWQLVVCKDYHQRDGYGRHLDNPFGAMYAIWNCT